MKGSALILLFDDANNLPIPDAFENIVNKLRILYPLRNKKTNHKELNYMSIKFNILTLFPEMFPGILGHSLAGKALKRGDWGMNTINIRDFATDNHKTVDDTPYGGGAGMVMRPDIIEKSLLSISEPSRKIYLSPRGKVLDQKLVKELSQEDARSKALKSHKLCALI